MNTTEEIMNLVDNYAEAVRIAYLFVDKRSAPNARIAVLKAVEELVAIINVSIPKDSK